MILGDIMRKIVLASNNQHKIKEFKEMLPNYEILSLKDIGFLDDIVEDGETFLDNSLIKAQEISNYLKNNVLDYDVIADDSGLCCEALDGAPGVFSARYAGNHNDQANRDKLINELKDKDRSAYFVCCIVLYHIDGTYNHYEGRTYGKIIDEERGSTEFGYDCIFLSDDLGVTFGQASSEEKNSVSHRSRAINKLMGGLNEK